MGLEGQYVSPINELKYNWLLHNGCVNVLIRVYPGTWGLGGVSGQFFCPSWCHMRKYTMVAKSETMENDGICRFGYTVAVLMF